MRDALAAASDPDAVAAASDAGAIVIAVDGSTGVDVSVRSVFGGAVTISSGGNAPANGVSSGNSAKPRRSAS
jgi:hypothetical protein